VNNFVEGSVVVAGSGQSGCVIQTGKDMWILLLNGDIWIGPPHTVRFPQDEADLAACPLDVDRLEKRIANLERE
jgi:hypothetical protein